MEKYLNIIFILYILLVAFASFSIGMEVGQNMEKNKKERKEKVKIKEENNGN